MSPLALVEPEEGLPAGLSREGLRRAGGRALRALGRGRDELTLSLVDDATIRELNRAHRGIDSATDVLSYSLLEGEAAAHRAALLGDVVISLETARRQARARHRSLEETVVRLLIHGMLHVVGHDHARDDEARAMRAEERRLWKTLRD